MLYIFGNYYLAEAIWLGGFGVLLLAELLIFLSEYLLYKFVLLPGIKKIFLITFIANLASALVSFVWLGIKKIDIIMSWL